VVVILPTLLAHTLTTGLTVEEVVAASRLAHPAARAVELSLACVMVPQVANFAEIAPKANATVLAVLLRLLDTEALVALDLCDLLGVKRVRDPEWLIINLDRSSF